jgi:hypothetical protein
MTDGTIDVSGYTPTDPFFGAPYVDEDTEWESPAPHRTIHGGFEDTDTRVRFHFPAGAGTIVDVAWDFDGSGTFPFSHPEVDGTATDATLTTSHTYERPGTYFATALVHSHRDGDVTATSRRLPNVAQARVVVT